MECNTGLMIAEHPDVSSYVISSVLHQSIVFVNIWPHCVQPMSSSRYVFAKELEHIKDTVEKKHSQTRAVMLMRESMPSDQRTTPELTNPVQGRQQPEPITSTRGPHPVVHPCSVRGAGRGAERGGGLQHRA